MYYAYLREDNESMNLVNNSGVLSLIEDLSISEENIFTDKEADRVQLRKVLELIGEDDYIIIRSVVDLADEAKELLGILKVLQEKQVTLVSILEQYLNGNEFHTAMKGFAGINKYYLERKRRHGFNEAKEAGTVGRPRQTGA